MGYPSSYHGNSGAAMGSLMVGLQEGSTAQGSGEVDFDGHTVAGTAVALTFNSAALDGVEPVELHFRIMDGTTQVAGAFTTSLDGETDLSGAQRRVDASGFTKLSCYDLFKQGGTIYIAPDADPGADGTLDYFIEYSKKKGG